jgi:hypothetical protein
MNIKIVKAYRTLSSDACCVIAGITIEQNVPTYMSTKINNLEIDAPMEVRYWRHPAELAIIHELDHSTIRGAFKF